MQRVNTDFCAAKSQGAGGVSRDEMLKNLASAFDSYMELKGNLEEGTKVRVNPLYPSSM